MKFSRKMALNSLILSALFMFAVPASAHELIPQALLTYIQQHPNATPEEITTYAQQTVPSYSQKYPDGGKILALVKAPQSTNPLDTLWDYLKLGVRHILSGTDHILFVVSLLLVFVSLKDIFKVTGSFTVAHSITLILAAAGAVSVSSRIVEPLIALSIAVVALASVYLKNSPFELTGRKKYAIVFFFGLFHGLGFAGLLRELGVGQAQFVFSLLAFNIGIEIGQLIIIALVLPVLLLLKKTPYESVVIKILATSIGIIGLLWAAERVLGYSIGYFGF